MILNPIEKEHYLLLAVQNPKINYENANKFSKQTVELIEFSSPANVVIDLENVEYVSSIGITAFSVIKGMSKINKCNIYLCNLAPEVAEVLEQTGINTMFKIFKTQEEILEHFTNTYTNN